MKTITIHVSETTYRMFQESAKMSGKSASELIRDAMEEYNRVHLSLRGSIFDQQGADAGKVFHQLTDDDDLLGEMLP